MGRVDFVPAPSNGSANARPLRIASFNVNFGVAESPANVAAIQGTNADVVLLQETTASAEAAFHQHLRDAYPHMVFDHCCRAGGLGILSRYPITSREVIDNPGDWFPAGRYEVSTPGGAVQFLAVPRT